MNQIFANLNSGANMPLLGLGVYDILGQEAIDAISFAIQNGYRLIDTASMYNNEIEVGKAIKKSGVDRKDLFITSKLNNIDHGYDNALKAYEQSLKKIDTDYLDLYLIHWPIKEGRKASWKALEKLYDDGLVKSIGVANYTEPFLKELETYSNYEPAVNQVEFSPFLNLENLRQMCQDKGIILQAYTPLVRGEKFGHPTLVEISTKYQKTQAQIILRWALQKGISTIPKSANHKRIEENFDIFDFNIESWDMNELNQINENYRIVDDPIYLI